MTPRSLFNIILKVLGIFLLKDIVFTLPQILTSYFFFGNTSSDRPVFWAIIFSLLILLIYLAVCFLLIFKTGAIINIFKLDQGFTEDKITVNVSKETILAIALIATGAFILIEEIPNLFRLIFAYFQQKQYGTNPNSSYLIYSGVKTIIALLLIGERKRIVGFMVR